MDPCLTICLTFLALCAVACGKPALENTLPTTCPENEEPTNCVTACSPTCIKPFNVTCNSFWCPKGCDCKPGFIRTHPGGSCVPITECGAYCGNLQEYKSCGSQCPDSCGYKNQNCEKGCVQGCFCKDGYILRGLLQECILETECPAPQ